MAFRPVAIIRTYIIICTYCVNAISSIYIAVCPVNIYALSETCDAFREHVSYFYAVNFSVPCFGEIQSASKTDNGNVRKQITIYGIIYF